MEQALQIAKQRISFTPSQWEAILFAVQNYNADKNKQALLQKELPNLQLQARRYDLVATKQEVQKLWGKHENMHALLAIISALPQIESFYRQKKIPLSILNHTLSDIPIWMEHCHQQTGHYGLIEYGWLQNHVRGQLFRLGRLQFMLRAMPMPCYILQHYNGTIQCIHAQVQQGDIFLPLQTEGEYYIGCPIVNGKIEEQAKRFFIKDYQILYQPNDIVLDTHIPEGEVLDNALVQESLQMAPNFFAKYFECPPVLLCETWLMDPVFAEIMPQSRIAAFSKNFTLVPFASDDAQMRERVFQNQDPLSANATNSLQKAIQAYYKTGKRCQNYYGFRIN